MKSRPHGAGPQGPLDRRARRRQETIDEILDIALDVMTEEGVNALTLAEVARRLGVQPPSLYKYFPSLMSIYDALFHRGQVEHLQVFRQALADAEPGLPAVTKGLEASGRWMFANPAIAQLMFWRPLPNFKPSDEAFDPSLEMVGLIREALSDAVDARQLGPAARSDEALNVLSILIAGLMSQAMANEPRLPWGEGRFTSLFPKLMDLFILAFAPSSE